MLCIKYSFMCLKILIIWEGLLCIWQPSRSCWFHNNQNRERFCPLGAYILLSELGNKYAQKLRGFRSDKIWWRKFKILATRWGSLLFSFLSPVASKRWEAECRTHCVMFWGPMIDPLFPKFVSLPISPSQFWFFPTSWLIRGNLVKTYYGIIWDWCSWLDQLIPSHRNALPSISWVFNILYLFV